MVTRDDPPHPDPEVRAAGGQGNDRAALGWALAAALCVHVLLFLVPLPAASPVVVAPPAPDDPFVLTHVPLPPPLPREAQPAPDPRAGRPRLPVPFPAAAPAEPVREPPLEIRAHGAVPDEPLLISTPQPPPGPSAPRIPGIDDVTYPVLDPDSKVTPDYPELARQARVETRVVLRAVILGDGTVGEIEVLRCDRPGLGFEQAAIEAIARWRYEPARRHGRPVDVSFTVVVDFELH
jgi:protein TonB